MRALLIATLAVAAGAAQAQPGRFFDAVDTNGDGVITAAEWKASGRPPQGFAMMDSNRDGKVTRAEGRAAMERIMGGAAPAAGAGAPK